MATTPGQHAGKDTLRDRAERTRALMVAERSTWIPQYSEISRYMQPTLGRFTRGLEANGMKRDSAIYDNTSVMAPRVLAAGLMSGMTSPARPWFKAALADRDLMQYTPVKVWLFKVTRLMQDIFAASNVYRSLHMGYRELGLFGTWACGFTASFNNVIHLHPFTAGEYCIATDDEGRVNSLCRDFSMTAGQMVRRFGRDAVSDTVRRMLDNGQENSWVPVTQIILPNLERDASKVDNLNMPFMDLHFETGRKNDKSFLSRSGFKKFPALAPRWDVVGNGVYGYSPGMDARGDAKQLQFNQNRKNQGIDYQTNPPIQVPVAYKDAKRNRLPGGVMYVDSTSGGGVKSAFDIQLNLRDLGLDIVDIRGRIDAAFYKDLFLMMANDDRSDITAREVTERHEEKMLMLGPVLERLHDELLKPLVETTFDYVADAGLLTGALEPPKEVAGMDLNIEFISVLAQAQRIVSAQSTDRLLATIGTLAQFNPGAVDKIDMDKTIDDYAEHYGTNPELIRDADAVAAIRAERQQQQQAAQAAAAAPAAAQAANAAKTASEIDTANLRNVLGGFQGYGTPQF